MSDRTGNGSTTLRRYEVRAIEDTAVTSKGDWLATVVVADDGYFSTVSEWGNYAYYWSHAGSCFRSFLARVDGGYLLGKIAQGQREYDARATLAGIKKHIVEGRREGWLSREDAREEWDLLSEHSDLYAREDFAFWYRDTKIEDAGEFYCEERPAQARYFAEFVWPSFVAALRAELAAEKVAA